MSKYLVVVNDHKERSGVELDHLMATANGLRDPIKRLLDSEEKGCLVLFVPAGLELNIFDVSGGAERQVESPPQVAVRYEDRNGNPVEIDAATYDFRSTEEEG